MSLRNLILAAFFTSLTAAIAPVHAEEAAGSGYPTSTPPAPLQQTALEAQR
jgi:hypothetical protein